MKKYIKNERRHRSYVTDRNYYLINVYNPLIPVLTYQITTLLPLHVYSLIGNLA